MNHAADVSECGLFRYSLTREWFPALPPLGFVMLNPSTADAIADDPTIRRCVGFARQSTGTAASESSTCSLSARPTRARSPRLRAP